MLKYGTLREDGYRYRGSGAWLSPEAWEASKEYARFYYIQKKYGVSKDQYYSLIESQNGKCIICKNYLPDDPKHVHVDHCHTTGKVRGILCGHCNKLIGYARENVQTLHNAARYLESTL